MCRRGRRPPRTRTSTGSCPEVACGSRSSSPEVALTVAEVTVTRVTARGCVVATDDEVVAREKAVIERAEPKRGDGHNRNNACRQEPTTVWYLRISRDGHPKEQGSEVWGSGQREQDGQVEQCPRPGLGSTFRHREREHQPQRRKEQRQAPRPRQSSASPGRETDAKIPPRESRFMLWR